MTLRALARVLLASLAIWIGVAFVVAFAVEATRT